MLDVNQPALTKIIRDLQRLCSRQEKNRQDIEQKLNQSGLDEDTIYQVITQLEKDGFVNHQRYANAFTHDKWQFNHWGRLKIAHQLRQKGIESEWIERAWEQVDLNAYEQMVEREINKKYQGSKAKSNIEMKSKLVRFAQSRGYEVEVSSKAIEQLMEQAEF